MYFDKHITSYCMLFNYHETKNKTEKKMWEEMKVNVNIITQTMYGYCVSRLVKHAHGFHKDND